MHMMLGRNDLITDYRPVGSNFKPVRPWAWSVGVASWCGSHSLFYAFNTLKSIHIYI